MRLKERSPLSRLNPGVEESLAAPRTASGEAKGVMRVGRAGDMLSSLLLHGTRRPAPPGDLPCHVRPRPALVQPRVKNLINLFCLKKDEISSRKNYLGPTRNFSRKPTTKERHPPLPLARRRTLPWNAAGSAAQGLGYRKDCEVWIRLLDTTSQRTNYQNLQR